MTTSSKPASKLLFKIAKGDKLRPRQAGQVKRTSCVCLVSVAASEDVADVVLVVVVGAQLTAMIIIINRPRGDWRPLRRAKITARMGRLIINKRDGLKSKCKLIKVELKLILISLPAIARFSLSFFLGLSKALFSSLLLFCCQSITVAY